MRPFSKQTLGRSLCQGVNAGLWCPGSEQRSEQRPAVGQWASGPVGQWASGPDSCYPIPWGLVYFGAVRTDRDLWTVCWFMFFFFLVWICLEYMKCHFGIGCVFSKCSLQIQFFFSQRTCWSCCACMRVLTMKTQWRQLPGSNHRVCLNVLSLDLCVILTLIFTLVSTLLRHWVCLKKGGTTKIYGIFGI